MRPATPIPAPPAPVLLAAALLAAFLLAGCRAPDPELPDEPPKPQAGSALPAPAGNVSRPPRAAAPGYSPRRAWARKASSSSQRA